MFRRKKVKRIEKEKKQLLYLQAKENILFKIRQGILAPGVRLPSEPELARELNVSRPTLREALKMLQREGLLISRNGVGTYVNDRPAVIENPLNKLQSVGEMIKNAGYQDSEANVSIYTMDPEREWKEKLRIDEKVLVMERSRTADGNNVAFYYNILPGSIAGSQLDQSFTGSIFPFLERHSGISISYSISEICSVGKSKRDKKAREILGDEILLLKQLHFDSRNKPVFYSLDYLKNSVFRMFVIRER